MRQKRIRGSNPRLSARITALHRANNPLQRFHMIGHDLRNGTPILLLRLNRLPPLCSIGPYFFRRRVPGRCRRFTGPRRRAARRRGSMPDRVHFCSANGRPASMAMKGRAMSERVVESSVDEVPEIPEILEKVKLF